MHFKEWLNENRQKELKATYYVAWTPFDYEVVVAISMKSLDESIKLATGATQLNVQVVPEPPMTYKEIQSFLDKLADHQYKHKANIKLLHGAGVERNRFSTI